MPNMRYEISVLTDEGLTRKDFEELINIYFSRNATSISFSQTPSGLEHMATFWFKKPEEALDFKDAVEKRRPGYYFAQHRTILLNYHNQSSVCNQV
jgi:hypothetical protein